MAGDGRAAPRGGEPTPGGDRPIRVLHVDDDAQYVELVAEFLERESDRLTVLTATTGAEGVERFESTTVDCVVSDYDMPDMDGLAFLDRLRERDPEVPFILLTGKGDEAVASEAVSRGVTDYVRKTASTDQYAVIANRVEQAVDRRRARTSYREIFEKATVGIVLHDPETGAINDINPRMSELLGYDREELLEMNVGDFSAGEPPYTQAEAEANIRKAAEEGTHTFEWLDETKAGEPVWVEVTLRRTHIGGRDQVLAIVRDINERKKREARLERENERLEEFASVVSHDLRNPLNVAQGYLPRVAEDPQGDALSRLSEALDRMSTIVDDSLTLARQGEAVTDPEPVAVGDRIRSWWDLVETGDAELVLEEPFVVHGDPDRLQQAFENLFRNSVEHGSTGSRATPDDSAEHADGPLTVRVGPLPDGFHVTDDGPGFPTLSDGGVARPPAEDRGPGQVPRPESTGDDDGESIFEVGYSTDSAGNGLGLAIVRRIAEAHGWSVLATNDPDAGARVEFHGAEVEREA